MHQVLSIAISVFGLPADPVRNDPNIYPNLVAVFGLSHGINRSVIRAFHPQEQTRDRLVPLKTIGRLRPSLQRRHLLKKNASASAVAAAACLRRILLPPVPSPCRRFLPPSPSIDLDLLGKQMHLAKIWGFPSSRDSFDFFSQSMTDWRGSEQAEHILGSPLPPQSILSSYLLCYIFSTLPPCC